MKNYFHDILLQKLLESFGDIKSSKVHRAALWILGEYATTISDIEAVMKQIHQVLGDGSLVEAEQRLIAGDLPQDENVPPSQTVSTLVTSDGTYATQSAFNTVQ